MTRGSGVRSLKKGGVLQRKEEVMSRYRRRLAGQGQQFMIKLSLEYILARFLWWCTQNFLYCMGRGYGCQSWA